MSKKERQHFAVKYPVNWTELHDLTYGLDQRGDIETAILGGALLDMGLLECLLSSFTKLTQEEVQDLVEGNGPLATLSARIRVAHAFKLITDEMCKELHTLRGIRNEFAHGLGLGFAKQSVRDRCNNLLAASFFTEQVHLVADVQELMVNTDYAGFSNGDRDMSNACLLVEPTGWHLAHIPLPRADRTDPRERFIESVRALWILLMCRTRRARGGFVLLSSPTSTKVLDAG